MITVDPVERITVKQLIDHKWFRNDTESTDASTQSPIESTKLNEQALELCARMHQSDHSQVMVNLNDLVQMRFNVRHVYGYHSATYWLIMQHWDHFKVSITKLVQC